MLAQHARDLVAVHLAQAQVEQHCIGRPTGTLFQTGLAVRRFHDFEAERFQQVVQDATVLDGIVHEKQPAASALVAYHGTSRCIRLTRAAKLTARAARVGFDLPDAEAVLVKLDEEVGELRAELPGADRDRLEDEVGDMLFVLANLARKLNLDPEDCMRHANRKFARRFTEMEQAAEKAGNTLNELDLAAMEAHWQAVKASERSTGGE